MPPEHGQDLCDSGVYVATPASLEAGNKPAGIENNKLPGAPGQQGGMSIDSTAAALSELGLLAPSYVATIPV
jgi:hypothetical protein